MNKPRPLPDSRALADRAAELALEKLATDVVVLDLRKTAAVCDYFVIASAQSEPQVAAVADRIEEGLRESGEKPWHVEGMKMRTEKPRLVSAITPPPGRIARRPSPAARRR